MVVDGTERDVLVDSGCSCSVIFAPRCESWERKRINLVTVSGEESACEGEGKVRVEAAGRSAVVNVLVVSFKPMGVDFILGMNGITALGGVTIRGRTGSRSVTFNEHEGSTQNLCASGTVGNIEVDKPDFNVVFDQSSGSWVMRWKWANNSPPILDNRLPGYFVQSEVREDYEKELDRWVTLGWLKPYCVDKMGPAQGLIPLMAVVQINKGGKVRPVLDFRELNNHVDAYTGDADVCISRLRDWRRLGGNTAVLDLSSAYMQIRVHESLWPYQTVIFRGRRYCLTRLGYGLNVAPAVMKAVLSVVLSKDGTISQATSAYVDDIYVNESVASVEKVRDYLACYGLVCKTPERVRDGCRVLGLWVCGREGEVRWKRGNQVPEVPAVLTRRAVFSLCGKLTSHFPVGNWLRPAAAFIKRAVNQATEAWDDEADDSGSLRAMIDDVLRRVQVCDPVKGKYEVSGEEATVWVDASSLAIGAVVAVKGEVIEDACWLRSDSYAHINMAELDAVVKGVNMALTWGMKTIHLRTDSQTVFHWVSEAVSGRSRLKTKAASEMLIRRRLAILNELIATYNLSFDVSFVPSALNLADALTRVPQKWLKLSCCAVPDESCAAAVSQTSNVNISQIHQLTGHQGVNRTLYFAQRKDKSVSKSAVRDVVQACQQCQSIDPASQLWRKGSLSVEGTWERVSMDITHVNGIHYLTLIDCGPSRFTIWRRLSNQDSASVVNQLESIFSERGAPDQLLTDNDAAFRSDTFNRCMERWACHVHFRCAYAPSGNGISERCHRSVKRISARTSCSILEAVYWYNVTPKDDEHESSAPANCIYRYAIRVRGIDPRSETPEPVICRYQVGDHVWMRPPSNRCNKKYDLGKVTRVISEQSVEVGGIPRHVRDLRIASLPEEDCLEIGDDKEGVGDLHYPMFDGTAVPTLNDGGGTETIGLRRSSRERVPPDRYGYDTVNV